ncbi:hypothetical protein HUJ04_004216 [Dendroctonus ponderosae]|nr:hypothetical protein HUJ04_005980 [Dendroctonus ponderosae]KAH0999382.1 hypothetical protein HUJ04_004216 [Dendroctonus ponderosae]
MADKGDGEGEGSILKLENQIAVLKYVLLFTNVLEWPVYLEFGKIDFHAAEKFNYHWPIIQVAMTSAEQ